MAALMAVVVTTIILVCLSTNVLSFNDSIQPLQNNNTGSTGHTTQPLNESVGNITANRPPQFTQTDYIFNLLDSNVFNVMVSRVLTRPNYMYVTDPDDDIQSLHLSYNYLSMERSVLHVVYDYTIPNSLVVFLHFNMSNKPSTFIYEVKVTDKANESDTCVVCFYIMDATNCTVTDAQQTTTQPLTSTYGSTTSAPSITTTTASTTSTSTKPTDSTTSAPSITTTAASTTSTSTKPTDSTTSAPSITTTTASTTSTSTKPTDSTTSAPSITTTTTTASTTSTSTKPTDSTTLVPSIRTTTASTTTTSTTSTKPTDHVNYLLESAKKLSQTLTDSSVTPVEASNCIRDISQKLKSLSEDVDVSSSSLSSVLEILSLIASRVKEPGVTADTATLKNFAAISDRLVSASKELLTEEHGVVDGGGLASLMLSFDAIAETSLKTFDGNDPTLVLQNIAIGRFVSHHDWNSPRNGWNQTGNWAPGKDIQINLHVQNEAVNYGLVIYRHDKNLVLPTSTRLGLSEVTNWTINSNVVSVVVSPGVKDVSVVLTFALQQPGLGQPMCAFLESSVRDKKQVYWSKNGCELVSANETHVQCQCFHMTPFAILMSRFGDREENRALSVFTKIGCYMSIVSLVAACLIFSLTWKHAKSDCNVLHVNLCLCLTVGYTVFLFGGDKTQNQVGCTVVAIFLHYIFLTAFFLMLAEGILIVKGVLLVFSNKSILRQILIMAYVLPLLIVVTALVVSFGDGYGDSQYCWLSAERGLVWAFIGPILFIIGFNCVTLGVVIHNIYKTVKFNDSSLLTKAKYALRSTVILSGISGSSWIFGVLSIIHDTIVLQYMFVVMSTLQGVFILCFQCLLQEQVREGLLILFRRKMAQHSTLYVITTRM
ncbi:adhesion G protein-coupled receptor L4-like isoform X2 [Physella acuta]|uniref:adhesion G protein-coupled receptor L4-like isoform X2 n=1 Tax=Physella acuta TaxID=109671 RepID=UPI0027DC1D0D|nr:adhesion G protein-coupled receptor L4-like isoform X2 [Physella acuta]